MPRADADSENFKNMTHQSHWMLTNVVSDHGAVHL